MATDNSARAAAHLAGYNLPQFSNAVEAVDNENAKILTADLVNATVTAAAIPGFTFSLEAGRSYTFRVDATYITNATTTGIRFSATFDGTATRVAYSATGSSGAVAVQGATVSTGQTGVASGAGTGPGATEGPTTFVGSIYNVTVPGTLTLLLASGVAVALGVTLKQGAVATLISAA